MSTYTGRIYGEYDHQTSPVPTLADIARFLHIKNGAQEKEF
jgi:hypothetical protein